jgi:hypothetical protein
MHMFHLNLHLTIAYTSNFSYFVDVEQIVCCHYQTKIASNHMLNILIHISVQDKSTSATYHT